MKKETNPLSLLSGLKLAAALAISVSLIACNGNSTKQPSQDDVQVNQEQDQTTADSNTDETQADAGTDTNTGSSTDEATEQQASNDNLIKVHYLNSNQSYANWGLHLWGDAVSSTVATDWNSPFSLTRKEGDYGLYEVPIVNADEPFNFIMHYGDFKNPAYDFSILPSQFGNEVWLVQDTPADVVNGVAIPFDNESDARAAYQQLLANIGNASASLDLSEVPPKINNTGLPDNWADTAQFAEIYIRGYQDSDGNGIGDIPGLISRLDYLADSGITGIWLMPTMESSDNDHGYATSDYRAVETDYGTLDDFKLLLDEAHARGIGVILDYVMNHSSSDNPLFQDAMSSPGNHKRDWYIIREDKLQGWEAWGSDPWKQNPNGYYYAAFSPQMPDFNLRNPEVIEFHKNNLRFWLNLGVDGFRFDAVGVLVENGKDAWEDQPDNHPVINAMKQTIEAYPNRYIVCESPTGYKEFANENSCGRAFHFSAGHGIIRSVKSGQLDDELFHELQASNINAMPLILANHDAFAGIRVWDQLNGNTTQYKLAAASYLLATQTPFTYYGEEIGLAGAANLQGDWSIRTPMSWNNDPQNAGFSTASPFRELSANSMTQNVESQLQNNHSLLAYYRSIYALRNQYPQLATGQLTVLSTQGDKTLTFSKTESEEVAALVSINYSSQPQQKLLSGLTSNSSYSIELGGEGTVSSNAQGQMTLDVPGHTALVLIKQ